MRQNNKHLIILIAIFISCLYACAVKRTLPTCYKDNTPYCTLNGAFRGKWYNYYKVGLSCMEGYCYDKAIESFQHAINKRNADQYLARSYGMHFIDYFPHRESGIAYYYLGAFEKSVEELERSISQARSEKAYFYLDKARTSIMQNQQVNISKPHIELFSNFDNELWTNSDPVLIKGVAFDDQFINAVSIEGQSIFMESARRKAQFAHPIRLASGRHTISVSAKNLLGGKTTKKIIVNVDRIAPVIFIDATQKDNTIYGSLYDKSGEIFLFANDAQIVIPKGKKPGFILPVKESDNKIVLIAKDRAGNTTKAILNKGYLGHYDQFNQILLASNDNGLLHDDTQSTAILNNLMHIHHWKQHNNTVFSETVTIEGHVKNSKKLKSLKVNNTVIIQKDLLNHIENKLFFSHSVKLNLGQNHVNIKAELYTGQVLHIKIPFTRKLEAHLHRKYRFGMKLYPFKHKACQSKDIDLFYHTLIKGLISKKRFQVTLSNDLCKELETNKIESTGSLSDKFFNQPVLKGVIYETDQGIEMISRIFDYQSRIIDFVDVYLEFDNNMTLIKKLELLASRMAKKFHLVFPMVHGVVQEINNDELIIQSLKWYHGKGKLRNGWQVYIFNKPATEPLEAFNSIYLGQSSIKRPMKQRFCIQTNEKIDIKIGDLVITQ
jgi:hypothetical protein